MVPPLRSETPVRYYHVSNSETLLVSALAVLSVFYWGHAQPKDPQGSLSKPV